MKALLDEDFIVCGYYMKADNLISVILGAYLKSRIVYQSRVTMVISRKDYKVISSTSRLSKNQYLDFPDFDGAIWLEPKLVCCVQFMERTPGGGLRQPVFRGLRDDKMPNECVIKEALNDSP